MIIPFALSLLLLGHGPAQAQTPTPANAAWLIGTWKGEHTARAIRSDSTQFEFRQSGAEITWKLERGYYHETGRRDAEGEGTVTKATDSTVELAGTYTRTTMPRNRGGKFAYTLTRTEPDVVTGILFGVEGAQVAITLKKVK